MKRFRLGRGRVAAGAGLAVALLWALPLPSAAAGAVPARSTGGKVYDKWCADCHAVGGPGSQALERKYQGQTPAVLLQRRDLAPDFVAAVVRQGMSFMPSFRKTEITDAELALLGAYLASPEAGKPANKAAPKKAKGE